MYLYDIYDKVDKEYVKTGCTMEAVIEAGHTLDDDEVRKYFGIDESNKWWHYNHRPFKVRRLVFDKCVIPDIPRYVLRPCIGEDEYP